MSINLSISLGVPAGVSTNSISYARIDNLAPGVSPTFINAGNFNTFPATIATNIQNGQYTIQAVPVYPDGRVCSPTVETTPACPGLTSISGVLQGNILIVTYIAPSTVPKVRLTVNFPNGGSSVANYVNNGNTVAIGLPSGVYGDYTLSGQSVCDESSGFYSPPSSTVTVSYNQVISTNVKLGNTTSTACSATPTTVYSSGPFDIAVQLFSDSLLTTPVIGFSYVVNPNNNHIYNLGSSGVVGSDTGLTCGGNAILTFKFVNAGGSFLNFQAALNTPIDGAITINRIFADGFSDTGCTTDIASAQKNTPMVINAGATAVGSIPDSTTGTWASAIRYSEYNAIINGLGVVNGSVMNIGSYNVTIVIPSCAS